MSVAISWCAPHASETLGPLNATIVPITNIVTLPIWACAPTSPIPNAMIYLFVNVHHKFCFRRACDLPPNAGQVPLLVADTRGATNAGKAEWPFSTTIMLVTDIVTLTIWTHAPTAPRPDAIDLLIDVRSWLWVAAACHWVLAKNFCCRTRNITVCHAFRCPANSISAGFAVSDACPTRFIFCAWLWTIFPQQVLGVQSSGL